MALHSSAIRSNDVRLPTPQPGEALLVQRYNAQHVKAVILHPDDFEELSEISKLVRKLDAASVPEMSGLAARAHRAAEAPEGKLIDDEASVKRLLRL